MIQEKKGLNMRRFLEKFLKRGKEKRPARLENESENEVFLKNAQEQLRELARKGLSIPVFTL